MSISMSKGKLRCVTEVCADCSSLDPSWASINKGVLLCDECCSIHRSLGRHISQIKSLKKGSWSPTLLQMVHTLNNHGVNNIWEHFLLDPSHSKSGRRKPQPKDPIHPVKADFIRAKHQMLLYAFRAGKDDTLISEDDLSRQLHSSVRTPNLETSLRLLVQGADPNYFHEEKGTTPLHVAAKAGQALQAELLVVNGADPGALNIQGKTPADIAWSLGHKDLADRLVECVHELTDRLAYYLCSRKPDHQNGQHFIVPELSDSLDLTELAKAARKKLQRLPNPLFEELAMDVYDEVDRREIESVWLSIQQMASNINLERSTVPFLPVNPEFSSTRNQGRQKLARFNARELASLIIDILSDAKRRQLPTTSSLILPQDTKEMSSSKPLKSHLQSVASTQQRKSEISDDEPLYDCVASDDDYLTPEEIARLAQQLTAKTNEERKNSERKPPDSIKGAESSILMFQNGPVDEIKQKIASRTQVTSGALSVMEENFKKQLAASEKEINDLKTEVRVLQTTVENLARENTELRGYIQRAGLALPPPSTPSSSPSPLPNGHEIESEPEQVPEVKSSKIPGQRPASMFEPREGLLHRGVGQPPHYVSASSNMAKWDKKRDPVGSEYDSPSNLIRPVVTQSLYHCSSPVPEEVVRRTDQVTKRIQELWASMQEPNRRDAFVPCAEKIKEAVTELTAIFPQNPGDDNIRSALISLTGSTARLQTECAGLQYSTRETLHSSERTFFLQQVRSCAYDIAKATKQLVTKYGVLSHS
uniref:Arf-GAP domain-containing protein n=1 Tax=Timema cristinae TaxID=61476 RepID=A0A7R9CR40_TIMCR|nr:unnamed protein product [Timema cristinae]